ncbi:MAG: hypothetical protein AAFX76_01910 [Planctomycetota bacterium]
MNSDGKKAVSSDPLAAVKKDLQVPGLVKQVTQHFAETGQSRPDDLRQLLGDPTKRVSLGSESAVNSFLNSSVK